MYDRLEILAFLLDTPNKGTYTRLEERFGMSKKESAQIIKELDLVVIDGKWQEKA